MDRNDQTNPADTRRAVARWLEEHAAVSLAGRELRQLAERLPTPYPGTLQAQLDQLTIWIEDASTDSLTDTPSEGVERALQLLASDVAAIAELVTWAAERREAAERAYAARRGGAR